MSVGWYEPRDRPAVIAQFGESTPAFKDELDVISGEVYEATYIHHVMEEINRLALKDVNVLAAMNEQPLFWQAHRAASQAALFMCLGRIFDTSPDCELNSSAGSLYDGELSALL